MFLDAEQRHDRLTRTMSPDNRQTMPQNRDIQTGTGAPESALRELAPMSETQA